MGIAKCGREKKITLAFGAVSALSALAAINNVVKIAATPADPLGLPKLPVRLAKLAAYTGVAVVAGGVAVLRSNRRDAKDRIRNALSPCGKGDQCAPD